MMIRTIRLFVALCLTTAGICASAADRMHLEHLDIHDGLSHNTITCIIQDSFGFMWLGTKDGLNLYDGSHIKMFKCDQTSSSGLKNNYVKSLLEDCFLNIWIGTDSGLYIYDRKTECISEIVLQDETGMAVRTYVSAIVKDKNERIWTIAGPYIHCIDPVSKIPELRYTSRDQGLRRLYVDGDTAYFCGYDLGGIYHTTDGFRNVSFMKDRNGHDILSDEVPSCFLPTPDGRLYVGSQKLGVTVLDPASLEWSSLPLSENGEDIYVRCLLQYSEEELWIGTEAGVIIYNTVTGDIQRLKRSLSDQHSLADNAIYSMIRDREGGIWIGSFFGGINYLHDRHEVIKRFYPTMTDSSIGGLRICEICPDGKGKFWIGTEDAGLYHFDPDSGEAVHIRESDHFKNIHGLMVHGDELWICTFAEGLKIMDTVTGRIREYREADGTEGIRRDFVFNVCECGGTIYVGTSHGLLRYVREGDRFIPEDIYGGVFIRDLMTDSKGNLWATTDQHGVFRKSAVTGQWSNWVNDPSDPASLPTNDISSVFEDNSSTMWFTTEGKGICKMNDNEDGFISYNSSIGFPSDLTCQIQQDGKGLLWISTIGGLVCFDPLKETVSYVYTTADGLLSNQFNYSSSLRDGDGSIWFGSIEGLICFDPDELSKQIRQTEGPVYITELDVSDEYMLPSSPDSPLKESILTSTSIKLADRQRSISMRLSCPSYLSSHYDHIQYKMDGVDDHWRTLGEGSGMVYYPLLPAGHFTFRTRLRDSDIPEKTLEITVRRPPLRSIAAIIFYLLLLLSASYLFIKNFMESKKRQDEAARTVFEASKEKELYDAKLHFFTSVAHEIRTPLSLIKGPLENILSGRTDETDMKEDLEIMDRNTSRLIDLVSELMDFNKVENKAIPLDLKPCDIVSILKDTALRFSSAAKQKGLTMTVNTPEEGLKAEVDEKFFIKVLSNLLNNALKYAASRIDINLTTEGQNALIRISNDGEPIAEEYREKIFEPFFRINEDSSIPGSGMGLPFARSIARMHDGDLILECMEGIICFSLSFPCREIGTADYETTETPDEECPSERTVLVVEDNSDMRIFISRLLSRFFRVLQAAEGSEAMELLEENMTDLVITDVMMPGMDGIELCSCIKSNRSFSHIPVIILSAKTSVEAKISGTRAGADVYLEKPFSPEYLLTVVKNLFENRDSLMQRYLSHPLENFHSLASSEVESELIGKIRDLIYSNLTNPDFNMDDIASSLAMSRATFYRKIKGLLNMTPNDYLKLERLKAAARLLSSKKHNVNEVSYMVGFNSPSYFTKCFQKQFGIAPKDFGKQSPDRSE